MTVQANGTDAKDIALHFIHKTTGRATPAIMQKTVIQAKSLLSCGYTKSEIIRVIDFILDVKGKQLYSIGYVNACINDVLKELRQIDEKGNVKEVMKHIEEHLQQEQKEVNDDDESTQRNRDKLSRFGVQPRFGKELDFNLFEIHRQDS
jgi:hypothetical protein